MKIIISSLFKAVLCLLLIAIVSYGQDSTSVTKEKERQPPANPDTSKVIKYKSPKGAMLRSLVLPGWGQFYNGKWFKGIIIGGTEIGLITNAIIQNQYAVQSETELEREFYRENRSLSIWWLGAAILYSITDAFVDAHLYNFDDSPGLSMNIKNETEPLYNNKYAVISLNLQIPL